MLACAALAACTTEVAEVTPPVTGTTPADPLGLDTAHMPDPPEETCAGIDRIDPVDGADGVYHRAPWIVDLTEDGRDTLDARLVDEDGVPQQVYVASWSADGRRALLRTATVLAPSTAYTLNVRTDACDEAEVSFTTSPTGTPIATASIAPAVMAWDVSGVRTLDRRVDRATVRQLLTTTLVDIQAVQQGLGQGIALPRWNALARSYELLFVGPQPTEDSPSPCQTATELAPETGWLLIDNPLLQIDVTGPGARLPLPLAGTLGLAAATRDDAPDDLRVGVQVERVQLSGSFRADRQGIDGIQLTTVVDARVLSARMESLGHRVSAVALCDRSAELGAPCAPCADGFRGCVTTDLDGLRAVRFELPEALRESCMFPG